MEDRRSEDSLLARRTFLRRTGFSLGAIALASLSDRRILGQEKPGSPFGPKRPHFSPRAKAVIYLNMTGAPSQVDLFDDKPKVRELDKKPVPDEYMANQRFAFIPAGGRPLVMAPRWKIERRGNSAAPMSELLPAMSKIVDSVTFVRSMVTDEINHVPAQLLIESGSPRMGRPSMGSWVTYGLGAESQDLPAFVVLTSGKAGRCGTTCWGSGFLPGLYQGILMRTEGDAVLGLDDPAGMSRELREAALGAIGDINRRAKDAIGDPEIETRIAAYEMAARMQTSVPGLLELEKESQETLALYGAVPGKPSFSVNCLVARRLIERGVRFVEICHGGWDHHGGGDQNLVTGLPQRCGEVDRGTAGLIADLDRRGMLKDVLVVWGGEFGRTPMVQGEYSESDTGRDHLRTAFTMMLAGGGVKRGCSYGETDDLGMTVVKDPVHVHDFQATILHLLGLDHKRLTYRHQGRDFRLTDVAGDVVRGILA